MAQNMNDYNNDRKAGKQQELGVEVEDKLFLFLKTYVHISQPKCLPLLFINKIIQTIKISGDILKTIMNDK